MCHNILILVYREIIQDYFNNQETQIVHQNLSAGMYNLTEKGVIHRYTYNFMVIEVHFIFSMRQQQ